MKKTRIKFIVLLLTVLVVLLLILTRQVMHANLSNIELFPSYTSLLEKDLIQISNTIKDASLRPPIGKTIFYVFVIGGVFSLSIAYLFIFMMSRTRIASLYFALAGLLLGLRLSFTKETMCMRLFYDFSPEAMIYGDLLTGILALIFFILFYWEEFIHEKYKKYMKMFMVLLVSYFVSLLIYPLHMLMQTFFIYQSLAFIIMAMTLYFTVKTIIITKKASYLNLIGFLIVFILTGNDVFTYSDQFSTNDFIVFGTFIYFVLLAIYLGKNVSKSYDQVEGLTKELHQLNQTLEGIVEERTEQLLNANEALENEEAARSRLLANVSHELNTPLTFIQGNVKAMLDEVIPSSDTSYLRTIYEDTRSMSYLVKDLQELSMLELGQPAFKRREVNICVFMKQIYEENKNNFARTQIHLTYEEVIDENIATELVYVDPARIKQVLQNILLNARRHTHEGGKIKITTHLVDNKRNQEAVISIKDTGMGIKDEDKPYVFERLFKANNDIKYNHNGSGLGLAISKEIINYHAGEIGADSVYGKGSTFYFTLPLSKRGDVTW